MSSRVGLQVHLLGAAAPRIPTLSPSIRAPLQAPQLLLAASPTTSASEHSCCHFVMPIRNIAAILHNPRDACVACQYSVDHRALRGVGKTDQVG
jgi:hypothetical protein